MDQERVLIFEATVPSIREVDGRISELTVKAWITGEATFIWSDNTKEIEQVNFCFNAYFNLMGIIPQLFNDMGKPSIHMSCDTDTGLIIVHDEDHPDFIFCVVREGIDAPLSYVTLTRGVALSLLDEVANRLASVDQPVGCSDTETSTMTDDPFAGIDESVRH